MMRKTKYKVFHQILSIMLCVVLVLGYMPVHVSADTGIKCNYVEATVDADGTINKDTKTCESATVITENTLEWGTAGATSWYVVNESTITIVGPVSVVGDVRLILADETNLLIYGGIGLKDENSHITIYGQTDGTGVLKAECKQDGIAGIGSNRNTKCGNITIHGGQIIANAGKEILGSVGCGAGIGAGKNGSECGDITIYGGTINVLGENTGIGAGDFSKCGNITIYDGIVNARSYLDGVGIGAGCGSEYDNAECGDITIYGGHIIAYGDESAGIGAGRDSSTCGNIAIYGGEISAYGDESAGIGAGARESVCGDISICGGEVTAIGGENGAGIGSSEESICGNITISGGIITAVGGIGGAGIGTGVAGECNDILINRGIVIATGGDYGAGIGAAGGNCRTITISEGTVIATGGEGGAGIGTGTQSYGSPADNNYVGTITISGGTITATGNENGAGIGTGVDNTVCENIIISGGTVTAIGNGTGTGIGSNESTYCSNITVTGGKITASSNGTGDGIRSGYTGLEENVFTLNGNAQVYTTTIYSDIVPSLVNGILFEGTNGVVYGNVSISEPFEVAQGQTLTILENAALEIGTTASITNNGDVTNNGVIINNGTFTNHATINNNNTFTNNSQITNEGSFVNTGSLDGTSNAITCTKHYEDDSTCRDSIKVCEVCGAEYEDIISHSGEYTANGNVITVDSCTSNAANCVYEGGTLTLTAEDRTYTGVLYTGASVSANNFPVNVTNTDIVYYDSQGNQFSGVPYKTGTYTAKVTVGNATAEDSFVISKAQRQGITVSMEDYAYGGVVSGPVLSEMAVEASSIVYYYNTTNSTVGGKNYRELTGTTLEPGTYYMYAVIGESENYLSYTTPTTTFTVKIGTDINNYHVKDVEFIYDGVARGITISLPDEILVRYGTEKGNYTLTETPRFSEVGTYTVYYQITNKGYYPVEGSATITVKAASLADMELSLEKNSYDYDGKAKTPAVVSKQRPLVKDKDYTVSYKNNKNIGTATVTITGKGNYIGTLTKTFTIKAKTGKTFTSGKYKYKVTSSSAVAFNGIKSTSTTKVVIPKTVKYGGKTFKVTSVANNALKNKTKVTSVTISGNITKIGKNAFYGCKKLKTITIETKSLKSVGSKAFKGILSTATVKVPTSKYASYKKLFDGKGLGKKNSIVINPIKGDTFTSGNNKYKVTSSSAVTFTGLKNTKKTEMSIPKTVTFGGKTFKVTAITEKALKGNTKLKKATIGENVKVIGASAFYGCKNLKTITIKSTKLTTVGKNALKGINAKATIKVPAKKLSAYKKLLKNKGQGKKVTIVKY